MRRYFYMLVISILIVGEIFFFFSPWGMMTICPLVSLKVEQEKKGVVSTGWLLKSEKFCKVWHCQLGSKRGQGWQGKYRWRQDQAW